MLLNGTLLPDGVGQLNGFLSHLGLRQLINKTFIEVYTYRQVSIDASGEELQQTAAS